MRRLSWKIKVTIWYTAFVLIIAAFSILLITRYAKQTFEAKEEEELEENVEEFVKEWKINEQLYYYEDDTVFSIYDENGALKEGYVPRDFPVDTILKDHVSQTIEREGLQWRTYDVVIESDGHIMWIRGIMYTTRSAAMEKTMLLIELSVLPMLVIFAAVGGYFITKRAFAPVEQIRKTAQQIAKSGELKERVPEWKTSGELQNLVKTFNGMLDSLENVLEEEKQFTADASHELRTPIAVIMSQSEYGMLEDTTGEEKRESLEIIHEQSRKMSELVSQLLLLSRSENKANIKQEKINISEAAEMVAEELRRSAAEKSIEITTSCQPELYISADQIGITRIFMNLVENAIQYGKEEGYIKIIIFSDMTGITCKIEDNGIGIAEKHLPHIFQRFYRVDKVRTGKGEVHAGLGLSMVEILVKKYGGQIRVESFQGKGTVFTLHFPLYENENIRYNK